MPAFKRLLAYSDQGIQYGLGFMAIGVHDIWYARDECCLLAQGHGIFRVMVDRLRFREQAISCCNQVLNFLQ